MLTNTQQQQLRVLMESSPFRELYSPFLQEGVLENLSEENGKKLFAVLKEDEAYLLQTFETIVKEKPEEAKAIFGTLKVLEQQGRQAKEELHEEEKQSELSALEDLMTNLE